MKSATLQQAITTGVQQALAEDVGSGDITAQLVPASNQVSARLISRAKGVLCGTAWVNEVFNQLDLNVQISWEKQDGDVLEQNTSIARLSGPARSILTGERTALNFLQTLSATATVSRYYADLVAKFDVQLLDTRKTLPGMRRAQKYAVSVGGCTNHRMGLFDAFLIKENHITACGSIAAAISAARELAAEKPVEVEVENLEQLKAAIDADADIVMLDNFTLQDIKCAVEINAKRSKLEVSGGITADSLVNIAAARVDYISIGALTKNVQALDLSLLLDE